MEKYEQVRSYEGEKDANGLEEKIPESILTLGSLCPLGIEARLRLNNSRLKSLDLHGATY
eukprot:2661154-Amphidinium_carterae.1